MENSIQASEKRYKPINEYKENINRIIEEIMSKNEKLVFAIVAEKAEIDPLVIRKYPSLTQYILLTILNYKEKKVIDNKIDKAVDSLLKSEKRITFKAIVDKCKFSSDIIYRNEYIKNKIRSILADNK